MATHKTMICSLVLILVGLILLATNHHYTLLPTPRKVSAASSSEQRSEKPRFIFVDLGANSADSLEVFLGHEGAKYSYDFPRPEWATHDQAGKPPRSDNTRLSRLQTKLAALTFIWLT